MARVRMVTRNVAVVTFDIVAVNMKSLKVETMTIDIPSADTMKEKQVIEIISTTLPGDMKYVAHTVKEHKDVLYGMPEVDFIRLAKVLPPRSGNSTEE